MSIKKLGEYTKREPTSNQVPEVMINKLDYVGGYTDTTSCRRHGIFAFYRGCHTCRKSIRVALPTPGPSIILERYYKKLTKFTIYTSRAVGGISVYLIWAAGHSNTMAL